MNSEYAIASGLVGFRSSSLRVRVTRREYGLVWCLTADIQDAGTQLILNEHQVVAIRDNESLSHKDGFVVFS